MVGVDARGRPGGRTSALTVLLPVAMPPVRPTRRKVRARSRLGPVRAGLDVHLEGHVQRRCADSITSAASASRRASLVLRRLEEQLVVHLEQHAAPEAAPSRAPRAMRTMAILMRSAAVPWMGALVAMRSREAAQVGVAAPQLRGDSAAPAEQRRDVAALAALRHGARRGSACTFGCRAKNWSRNSCACFGGDVEPARQPEGGDAVDDRRSWWSWPTSRCWPTSPAPSGDAEDLGGGAPVDVLAAPEGLDEALLAGDVGEDAQLDLRVVGGQRSASPRSGTKAARMRRPSSVRIGNVLQRSAARTTTVPSRPRAG